MSAREAADRAAMWLGAAAIASLVFLFPLRELKFLLLPDVAIPVLIGFGLVAVVAGWLRSKLLTFVAGGGFGLAAVVYLVLQTNGDPLVKDSNGSTFSLLLGLGVGLLALALTPRPQ